jgi:hypothetical protein
MTVAQFRRLALRMPEAVEASHMDHPDFRVDGKIFATLGYPTPKHGVVMLTPAEQKSLMRSHPGAFGPAAGKWGDSGSTVVTLAKADARMIAAAIESAWRRRAPTRLRQGATARPGAKPRRARPKAGAIHADTKRYNNAQAPADRAICKRLAEQIALALPEAENKVWHAHPVWFLDSNPIVGYSKLKDSVRLLFWSGQSFKEKGLTKEGTFKAAEARYTDVDEVDTKKLAKWLAESRNVQWDYKNLIRRKGRLERLKLR